jgi:hypothetical protein
VGRPVLVFSTGAPLLLMAHRTWLYFLSVQITTVILSRNFRRHSTGMCFYFLRSATMTGWNDNKNLFPFHRTIMSRTNAKAYEKKKPGCNIFVNKELETQIQPGDSKFLTNGQTAKCGEGGGVEHKVTQQTLQLYGIWGCHSVVMKSFIFWDITPCSPLQVNRIFGGTWRLHLQGRHKKWISRADLSITSTLFKHNYIRQTRLQYIGPSKSELTSSAWSTF